jgi:hypothetical protein
MRDGDIDYSKYSLHELEEALSGINRQLYPKNYANLKSAYVLLASSLPTEQVATATADFEEQDEPLARYDKNGRYVPNHISSNERIVHVVLPLLLFAYGTYGVWANDLYIPGKRSRGIHLHDSPAWTMYGAIICACLVMLSVVVDHYDRRNNETNYRFFANLFTSIGWILFTVSLVFGFIRQAQA